MIARIPAWLAGIVLLGLFLVLPAQANAATRGATCHAMSGQDASLADMLKDQSRWTCSDDSWSEDGEVAWLRFDVRQDDIGAERLLVTRNSRFDRLSIHAVDADGTVRSLHHHSDEVSALVGTPSFAAEMPEISADTKILVVQIVRPFNITIQSEAHIVDRETATGWSPATIAVLAMIAGLLVMPLLFDIYFYWVMREKFVLLHASMIVAMLAYVLSSGGLVTAFLPLSVTTLAIVGPLSWAIGIAISGFFCIHFLEDGALSPVMRRLMIAAALWVLMVPAVLALQLGWMHSFANKGYFIAFVPVIVVYLAAMAQAAMRGSKTVRLIILAWVPIIASSTERIARGIGMYSAPSEFDMLLFAALGVEVLIIALGVANRFMALKRERDQALAEAATLERLASYDPLTGLMNRRVVEERFDELFADGFSTVAVIDLDLFKLINDQFGHSCGDEVLRSAATALAPDQDTLAIRMGGEEFLLLLRGPHAAERAEQRRRAITTLVARQVGGLDRPVTASMGLVEADCLAMPGMEFAHLYACADQLLYEAKNAGRNRTMHDRMTGAARPAAGRDQFAA